MITINKEILKNLRPCAIRWKNYLKHYPEFEGTIEEFLALDKITTEDKIFVIKKTVRTKHLVSWAQKCAESVSKFKYFSYAASYAAASYASYAASYAADAANAADAASYASSYASYASAYASYAASYASCAAYHAANAAAAAAAADAAASYAAAYQWTLNFKFLVQVVEELKL